MDFALMTTAFAAGMISTINPCGFAMLPAYVSYFLVSGNSASGSFTDDNTVIQDNKEQFAQRDNKGQGSLLMQALLVGGITTIGFVALFASAGTLLSLGALALKKAIPWIGLMIGALLIFLGIWVLSGHHLSLPGIFSFRVKKGKNLKSFFLFGVSYSLASLTCTLPIFLAVVGSVFTTGGAFPAIAQFFLYALGMGFVMISLTLSIAFFKGALVSQLRRIVPYVERISAVLMLGAGGYIVYYWLSRRTLFINLL